MCLASQVHKIPSRALIAPLRCNNGLQVRCISQISNSGGSGGGRKVPVKFTKCMCSTNSFNLFFYFFIIFKN